MFSKMKCLHLLVAIISLAFANIVATVPASVLAQNTELAKENNNNNNNKIINNQVFNDKANNLHDDSLNFQKQKTEVKRSSNNVLNLPSESSSASALNSVLDKKSSPEVVPADFNSPNREMENMQSDQDQELQLQQQYQQQRLRQEKQQQLESASSLMEAGLRGLSAITADITAALQKQKQQQQQKLQQQQQQQQQISQNYYDDISNYNNNNNDNKDNTNFDYEIPQSLMQKRGINMRPYVYGLRGLDTHKLQRGENLDNYNNNNNNNNINPYGFENALLADNEDVGNIMYNDLDDSAQTSRGSNYRSKAYDNLQSILNSEAYAEPQAVESSPVYMPLQYDNGRYYGGLIEPIDREKNKRVYQDSTVPLKRDTKLSPADMLALVALLEAGDRSRLETEEEPAYIPPAAETYNARGYYNTPNPYEYAQVLNSPMEEMNFNAANDNGAWVDPPIGLNGYYGLPINVETVPKYEVHKYAAGNANRYNNKRFMVAKKKRSPLSQTTYNYAGQKYF